MWQPQGLHPSEHISCLVPLHMTKSMLLAFRKLQHNMVYNNSFMKYRDQKAVFFLN